jgi:hypothetical protein
VGAAIAGCSGGGGDGDGGDGGSNGDGGGDGGSNGGGGGSNGDGGGGDGGSNGDGGGGGSSSGSVTNNLDGFEVIDHSGEATDEQYQVTANVENVGDETVEFLEHGFSINVYDASGNDITGGGSSSMTLNAGDWEPGETIEMRVSTSVDGELSEVESYEIVIDCDGFDEGAYC